MSDSELGPPRATGDPTQTGPTGERPRRGGTLRVALTEDVDSLDPQLAALPSSWFFVRALHRGLMAFPPLAGASGAVPVPDLAAGPPSVTADGLGYRFRLREGIRFGAPASRSLTSADVRAGLERMIRLSPAGWFDDIAGAGLLRRGRAAHASGIGTPDARTVDVRLVRPANDLLWMLAVPQAAALPVEIAVRARISGTQISPSGPYRVASYEPESRLVLERNPAWTAATDPVRSAHVDRIDTAIGLTREEIEAGVSRGTIDMQAGDVAATGLRAAPAPRSSPEVSAPVETPTGCLRYLWMNTTVRPFDRTDVRRAVVAALDPATVTAGTYAIAASGILPPTVLGTAYGGDAPVPAANPAAAKSMLARAGFGSGFSADLVVGDTPLDLLQASRIRRLLAPAGVRVSVRPTPVSIVYEDRFERPAARVPMGIATWCADWPGLGGRSVIGALLDYRRIAPTGNTVYSMLRSALLVQRIDAAIAAEGDEARLAWRRADLTAAGAAAVVPLCWQTEPLRRSGRLHGLGGHFFFVRGDPTAVWFGAGGR